MKCLVIVSTLGLSAWGCANPLNAITAERYRTQCGEAERNAQLTVADEACRRALINVRLGNLGPHEEAGAIYNLGRIRRRLGNYSDAETMFGESLRLEETVRTPDKNLIFSALFELALSLDEEGRTADAWPFLDRLIGMSNRDYGDVEKQRMVKDALGRFAEVYDELQLTSEADKLRKRAQLL